jgi:hypothetical protein
MYVDIAAGFLTFLPQLYRHLDIELGKYET